MNDNMNPKVDFFFAKEGKWQNAYTQLRTIALDCGLNEELKWGCPCYTSGKKNIVLIHGFRDYCALLFFKGALLKDSGKILVQQTERVQSVRQIRFTGASQITKMKAQIKKYIFEAVEVEKAGLRVELKKTGEYPVPDEFKAALDKKPALKKAFYALTPGRQRGYLTYFAQAKQSATRKARVEKYTPQILRGKGLND